MTAEQERAAVVAEELGKLYRDKMACEWACREINCVFPLDGNCECFNSALATFLAQRGAHHGGGEG